MLTFFIDCFVGLGKVHAEKTKVFWFIFLCGFQMMTRLQRTF